uniref:PDZ domain-containing protein n=1 Tax=Romanomermis culicivorax TaxID=13658 RepID=A0A915JHN7_ROMCU
MHSGSGIIQLCASEALYQRFSPPCPPLPPRDKSDVLAARCYGSRDNTSEKEYMTLNRSENAEPPYDSFPNLDTLNVNSHVRSTILVENLIDNNGATMLLRDNVQENMSNQIAAKNMYENVPAQEDRSIAHSKETSLHGLAAYSEVKLTRSVENLTARGQCNFISPDDASFKEIVEQENRLLSSSQASTSAPLQPSIRESAENCRTLGIHCGEAQSIRLSIKEKEVIKLKQEISSILKIKVNAEAAVRGLAFVDLDCRIWVAGWNLLYNKCLSGAFHVGDELISIDDRTPNNTVEDTKRLLDSLAFTGTISITIRRLPFGNAFCLRREYEGQNLGILTKKGKNEIIFVDENSVAAKCGLPATVSSYINPTDQTNWFLTEINGRPLSLFANSNEALGRLSACGRDLMIVVQPTDFVKSLRKKLKRHTKNYKDFVIGLMEKVTKDSQARIVNAVEDFMEKIDRSHVRQIERALHLCAADCCKDSANSKDTVQRCVMQCAKPMEMVQQKLESELTHIQDRLSRCYQSCNDKVRDQLGSNIDKPDQMMKRDDMLKLGIEKCTDELLEMLPKTLKNCQDYIKSNVKT